jgi:release factor glutamine methyltransferase
MNLKDVTIEGTQTISQLYPEREAREMVYAALEKILGTTRHTHILEPYYKVSDDDLIQVRSAFSRMASGEPLQYVLQEAWFYGRRFNVSPDVLIPRPETELLCRTVIDSPYGVDIQDMPSPARGCPSLRGRGSGISTPYGHMPMSTMTNDCRLLDLCTGSGCIAWTLALEMPGAEVVAVDLSDGALKVADSQDFSEEISSTAARKPQFLKADVLAQPLTSLGQFDVIVSNPPYVMESEKALMRSNVLDYEPHLALFVSDDDPLLFYRAVAKWALLMLKPGGYGIVEINEALAFDTEEIFRGLRFRHVRTIKDLHDRDRFVTFEK